MSKDRRSLYTTVFVVAVIIALTVAVIMWFKPNNNDATLTSSASTIAGGTTMTGAPMPDMSDPYNGLTTASTQNNTSFDTGLERLPQSLQGTDVDGEIIIDENKQLVVTEGLRALFDYFLSALGEEDESVIFARVESYIRSHVPEPAASQAIAIFNQYVKYLKQIPQIEERYGNLQLQATKDGGMDLHLVAQRQQDVSKLRKLYFDTATITAFFGREDDYDSYSIAMIEIEQNKQLSDAQKEAARRDYVSRMPDNDNKANIKQQASLGELMTRTEEMKAKGASPEALYNMRSKLVGVDAAKRLAEVDAGDASFDKRFNQYQTQKQQLLSQNPTDASAQITQIEQQLFTDTERKRLSGYAAMQKAKSQ